MKQQKKGRREEIAYKGQEKWSKKKLFMYCNTSTKTYSLNSSDTLTS